eukprot:COSAG02_NODE_10328_length_1967_cov_1.673448_3_plen_87_part_01
MFYNRSILTELTNLLSAFRFSVPAMFYCSPSLSLSLNLAAGRGRAAARACQESAETVSYAHPQAPGPTGMPGPKRRGSQVCPGTCFT